MPTPLRVTLRSTRAPAGGVSRFVNVQVTVSPATRLICTLRAATLVVAVLDCDVHSMPVSVQPSWAASTTVQGASPGRVSPRRNSIDAGSSSLAERSNTPPSLYDTLPVKRKLSLASEPSTSLRMTIVPDAGGGVT